ncbi:MAG: ion transporter [Calditrichaeota bacterium]|nr:ion transporter [Calditrichota bacterium]
MRKKIFEIIFEADTKAGKLFDIVLILTIILSVIAVIFDSVKQFRLSHGDLLFRLELIFTILFTIEYILRIYSVEQRSKYIFSFFGIIDLLAILPTYISFIVPGAQFLLVIRVLRVLRVFRVLKLVQYLSEANVLMESIRASSRKILVFLFAVFTMAIIFGSLMYVVEGEESGYTSIPRGIYWAIVTLTTVGYGDITPSTELGKFLASLIMIMGYGVIAVPTGIVTAELTSQRFKNSNSQVCMNCHFANHDDDAKFCKKCGYNL